MQWQFVLSNACPCNLLGRDMMQALNIAVVPTQRGVKALRIHDSNVIEGEDVPHYWYSLDLVNVGPSSVTSSPVLTGSRFSCGIGLLLKCCRGLHFLSAGLGRRILHANYMNIFI